MWILYYCFLVSYGTSYIKYELITMVGVLIQPIKKFLYLFDQNVIADNLSALSYSFCSIHQFILLLRISILWFHFQTAFTSLNPIFITWNETISSVLLFCFVRIVVKIKIRLLVWNFNIVPDIYKYLKRYKHH